MTTGLNVMRFEEPKVFMRSSSGTIRAYNQLISVDVVGIVVLDLCQQVQVSSSQRETI